jgi:hypothetical protein
MALRRLNALAAAYLTMGQAPPFYSAAGADSVRCARVASHLCHVDTARLSLRWAQHTLHSFPLDPVARALVALAAAGRALLTLRADHLAAAAQQCQTAGAVLDTALGVCAPCAAAAALTVRAAAAVTGVQPVLGVWLAAVLSAACETAVYGSEWLDGVAREAQLARAQALADRVAGLSPDAAVAARLRALVLLARGDGAAAEALLRGALQAAPTSVAVATVRVVV